ncbi:hypothetical protein C345_06146 [Cryptococcus neoformans A2-102-5]|nr:hypothetical protein C346_02007 [Cryptococcus neoformans var. grubii D17-1]OXG91525.1 hypothetical protein C345_06146 [Cryptococcus neoformans var. grubii A2-102-5]
MSMAAPRPFAGPSYPISPTPTTPSVGYSQYGSQSFAGAPSRQLSMSSSAYAPSASVPSNRGPGMKTNEKKGESREVARVHWRALKEFLSAWIERESPSSRASAREKLTRLTKLQFQELSTDVYDELMRRLAAEKGEGETAPFLPVREDFHPKRNQARQKLATLPNNRFKDLASDVFYELRRRFPDFDREDTQAAQTRRYDEPPPAPGPRPSLSQSISQQSFSFSAHDRASPTPLQAYMSRNESSNSLHQRQGSRQMSRNESSNSLHQRQGSRQMSSSPHRSRPSNDPTRQVQRDPEEEFLDDGLERRPQANHMAATNDVIVPSKSRLREEEIEVPYARDSTVDALRQSMASYGGEQSLDNGRDSRASYNVNFSLGGDRSRSTPQTEKSQLDMRSPESRGYRNLDDKASLDEEREKRLRSEYEFRISGLDRKLLNAEKERDEARRAEAQEKNLRMEWEEEVRTLKEQAVTHASSLRALQHELDLARDQMESARQRADEAHADADQEVRQWRERCEQLENECRRLEDEKAALEEELQKGGRDGQAMGDMKQELQSLVDELNSLSVRNDELMTEREQDAARMSDMEARVSDYRRKYDAVRIELRNLKATSTVFATFSKPVTDDHLPASPDGNIMDVNVSAFQSSIDGLLSAARSSTPSGVLPAMKAIVEAITSIGEDVKSFEAHPNLDVDVSRLESLKHESTSRLNNLMQSARNHAMASGLSPVSLLDAAAGHLSANVIEIIKLLKIKRSDKNDLKRSSSRLSIRDMVNRDRDRERERANESWDNNYRPGSRTETPDSRGLQAIGRTERTAPSRSDSSNDLRYDGARTATPTEVAHAKLNGVAPPSSYRSPSATSALPVQVTPSSAPMPQVSPSTISDPSLASASSPATAPAATSRPTNMRINSFQSTSTTRSDSFDLERKSTLINERSLAAHVEPRGLRTMNHVREESGSASNERESLGSTGTASSNGGPMTALGSAQPFNAVEVKQDEAEDDGREWEDLRPYLNGQSSALVNSIQNLLASIRTNASPSVLNEHLSEVIAIASSIVAVSTNALPSSLRAQGDGLLRELVNNTNKLSEAQELGKQGQGSGQQGGFEKGVRQQIASASFGVAKSLKALMKLGGNE